MTTKFTKYGLMIIAAVLLVGVIFAGAASADATNTSIHNWTQLKENITYWNENPDGMLTIIISSFDSSDASPETVNITVSTNITVKPTTNWVRGEEFTLDAKQQGRFFNITDGGNLIISEGRCRATFNLTGGNVSESEAAGAVYIGSNGRFELTGGVISDCKAGRGGAVYISPGATFIMNAGTIKNCEAVQVGGGNGGGVYLANDGTFELTGGTITECICAPDRDNSHGGGVYVKNNGKFNISGNAYIVRNTNGTVTDDVSLRPLANLNLVGDLTGKIGIFGKVRQGNPDRVVLPKDGENFGKVINGASGAENFFDDNSVDAGMERLTGRDKDGKLQWIKSSYVEVNSWDELVSAASGWKHTEKLRTIVLTNTASGAYKNMTGQSGEYMGIQISGNVMVMPKSNAGTITIDANDKGRIFKVGSDNIANASLTLSGNRGSTLELINGNASSELKGRFNHQGKGGAIYVSFYNGKLTLCDGVTITDSTAEEYGGGVYISAHDGDVSISARAADLDVSGNVNIIGNTNTSGTANNLYLKNYTTLTAAQAKLTLVGKLTGIIGVSSGADDDERGTPKFLPAGEGIKFGTACNNPSGAENFVADGSDNPIYVGNLTDGDTNGMNLEWTAGCLVTFDPRNGEDKSYKPVKDNTTVAKPDTPFKSGYAFDGWYYGNTKWDFTTKVTNDMTLTARWKAISNKDAGSTIIMSETVILTATPTPVATATPGVNITVEPTVVPINKTQTSKSPVPFVGLIAGLGVVAVLLRMRK